MALDRSSRYPGRWETPSVDYPMGKFKNRSDETTSDGSYIERDWANDWDGYFGSIMRHAAKTPNGEVDTAQSSQYFDAAAQVFNANATLVSSTGVTARLGSFVFTGHGAITLPVLPDGAMIRVSVDSSVDLASGDCIVDAPSGETIRFGKLSDSHTRVRSKDLWFTFVRLSGQWSV